MDPENSDCYVPSSINETLLNDLNQHTIDKVSKTISWLDDLSNETTVKLIEKRVIIEIDDDDYDDDEDMNIIIPSEIDAVIDLNVVKNVSLDDRVVDTEATTSYIPSLLKQNDISPEISHLTETEIETFLPFKKRRKSIYVGCPNLNEHESYDTVQKSTVSPVTSDQQAIIPCTNAGSTHPRDANISYPSTPMVSIAAIDHLLHDPSNLAVTSSVTAIVYSDSYDIKIDFGSGSKLHLFGNIKSNVYEFNESTKPHFSIIRGNAQEVQNLFDYLKLNQNCISAFVIRDDYFVKINFESGLSFVGKVQSKSIS